MAIPVIRVRIDWCRLTSRDFSGRVLVMTKGMNFVMNFVRNFVMNFVRAVAARRERLQPRG